MAEFKSFQPFKTFKSFEESGVGSRWRFTALGAWSCDENIAKRVCLARVIRRSDLAIMAYLYEEIYSRDEKGLRPQSDGVRALLALVALDFPQAKKLTDKDNWELSLIEEIQRGGFLEQLYKK